MTLDVLAFSPHPDDAELFAGGLLAKLARRGYRVGIVDLTRGELASHGDIATRAAEAAAAAAVLGLAHRENLGLADGHLAPWSGHETGDRFNASATGLIVDALRRLRPELVLSPPCVERHPDHAMAGTLVRRAVFMAGLRRLVSPGGHAHHGIRQLLFYPMRCELPPSFIVDVSAVADVKRAAIAAHVSQIGGPALDRGTLIGSPLAQGAIDARDRYYGAMIGASHGEPYLAENALSIDDPLAFARAAGGRPHFFPHRG